MKGLIRKVLFETLGSANYKIDKADDLIILTSSRSGSTWLVESLSNSGKFKLYNQPTDTIYNTNYYLGLLPNSIRTNPFLINLNEQETVVAKKFWSKVFGNKINPNTNWRWFSKQYNFQYRSKLIKVFTAKSMLHFFVENKKFKVIYLTRDPLQRAFSNIAYGYNDCGNLLIANGAFRDLSEANRNYLENLYKTTSSRVTKHVIGWYAENYCVLRCLKEQASKSNFLHVSYERMISDKKEEEASISSFLDLEFKLSQKKSKTTNNRKDINNLKKDLEKEVIKSEIDSISKIFKRYLV